MKSFRTLSILAIIALLGLTGCQQPINPPNPSITAAGYGKGSKTGADADWVSGQNVGGPGGEGLEIRDAAFSGDQDTDAERALRLAATVYFDFDNYAVKPDQRTHVDAVVSLMKESPELKVMIEGFCDWKGTTEYNMILGDKRADSVRKYMVQSGIDISRIEIVSMGDLEAQTNAEEEQMKKDRRADILKMK
jgi:peptidoglycan-associated lipoprotein